MELSKEQAEGFAKIIRKGMAHYRAVPHSLGSFDAPYNYDIVGYVLWKDAEANFTTENGDTNQEFYIKENGDVCVYIDKVFTPVIFRSKTWNSFCNPKTEGSEVGD